MNTPRFSATPAPTSSQRTAVDLNRAFREIERKNLPYVTFGLGVFYLLATLAFLVIYPIDLSSRLIVMSILTAAGLFGVAIYTRRAELSPERVGLLAGLTATAVSLSVLYGASVVGKPAQVLGVSLLMVGVGLFVASAYWYAAIMSLLTLGWSILVWRNGATEDWLGTLLVIGGAVLLSAIIYFLRQRVFKSLEASRLHQLRQQEELERALREQERIQNELRETETRFRTLVEQLPAATFIDALDATATTLYISPQIESISGYSPQEWKADPELWHKILHPEDRSRVLEALKRHNELGERFNVEYRIISRDGRVVWLHDDSVIIRDVNGAPVNSQGYMTDITARKESEDAMRRRDAIYETVRYAAETFLRAQSWEDRIDRVLARLGTTTQASRVSLLENQVADDGSTMTTIRYQWHASNVPSLLDPPAVQHRSYRQNGYARWETLLMAGKPVYGNLDELPENERPALRELGITSLAVIPVFVGREWWGVIGFDICSGQRTWLPMEVDALQAAANTLGAAIQRRRDEKALALARDLALEASRLKSEFLAMISHEIRTPMNSIVGMSELLLETPLDKQQREYAGSVRHASDALLTIINDILDLSKIEAGRFTLEQVPFDLPALIASTIDIVSTSARDKGLVLKVEITENAQQEFQGDAGRLRQILLNLVSNAIKFTERGSVIVRISTEGTEPDSSNSNGRAPRTRVRFVVTDTGIGISDETRDRLFLPFMQGDMSITRRYGGTGLGLAISRRLVDMMEGEIGVTSVEGKGSTFWFQVPLEPATEGVALTRVTEITQLSAMRTHGVVLLAEDNVLNQRLTEIQLAQLGIRKVRIVETGRAVVNALRNPDPSDEPIALVLMDCQMPEMDGFAATRAVRELERDTTQHIPIVAMTASASSDDKEACLAAGMDDYVVKPVQLEMLRAALDRWLPTIEPDTVTLPTLPASARVMTLNNSPMDFQVLETLRTFEGPDGANETQELAMAYLTETEARLTDLRHAVEQDDVALARSIAHLIRGSSAGFGARGLAELAREIEDQIKNGSMERAAGIVPLLRMEFERVKEALKVERFVV